MNKPTINVKYETNYKFAKLTELVKHLKQYQPSSPAVCADIVRGHGFDAHIGGHHVAIIQGAVRLALVTSATLPDFN